MVGATIKFDNWSPNIFKVLFKDIDVSNWYFSIMYWESYGKNTVKIDLNEFENISSEIIKKELIIQDSQVFPEFMELYISFCKSKRCEIKTYNDFIKSNYSISLIIIDHRNIEICCKDENVLKKMISNFKESSLENKRINELYFIQLDSILKSYRSKSDKSIYD